MCEEVSWEEVVEVIKYLKYGKALSPDGIKWDVNLWECKIGGCAAADDEYSDEEWVIYGSARLVDVLQQEWVIYGIARMVDVLQQMVNIVMRWECKIGGCAAAGVSDIWDCKNGGCASADDEYSDEEWVIYGSARLVGVLQQMINIVMRNERYPLAGRGAHWYPSSR